jgi:hypothetical protein
MQTKLNEVQQIAVRIISTPGSQEVLHPVIHAKLATVPRQTHNTPSHHN